MAQSIAGAIGQIQDLIGALTGVRAAPDQPVEKMSILPLSLCYVGPGDWLNYVNGGKQFVGDIMVELHVPRKDLARDMSRLMSYVESVPNEIMSDPTLGGTVASVNGVRCNGISQINNADGTSTLALIWAVHVKMQNALT